MSRRHAEGAPRRESQHLLQVAGGLALLLATATGCSDGETSPNPPVRSLTTLPNGLQELPGIGGWLDVYKSPDPRELFVLVEEITKDRTDSCWDYYVPHVERTASQIAISITAYSKPEPGDLICGGAPIGRPVVRVPLDEPYAGEAIVDAGTDRVRKFAATIDPKQSEIVNLP